SGSTVQGNHFFDNPFGHGLILGEHTSANTVRDNDLTGQYNGITVYGAENQIIQNAVHGNSGFGIFVQGGQNTISQNSIYGNGGDGVFVGNGANGISILGNSISANGGLGIHLDAATNANDNQAAPVLRAVVSSASGLTVSGSVPGASRAYLVQVFANPSPDPT